jgi:outer membrane protein insertion porin family
MQPASLILLAFGAMSLGPSRELPASAARAQEPQAETHASLATVCGMPVPSPTKLPPDGSPPVVLALTLCFDKQGGGSVIDPQTYLHYIQTRPSEPSRDIWIRYDENVNEMLVEDFRRLWATSFLDDLSVAVEDRRLSNGTIGKLVIFHLEERQRIRIVSYEGSDRISASDIDSRLKERGIGLRVDAFLDRAVVKQVTSVVRELYAQKGYQFAEVKPAITGEAGGPKLVNVAFHITEGPKVAIRDVEFVGNRQMDDDTLAGALKANRPQGLLSMFNGSGVYQADKFAEDADRVVVLYRNRGYINARVGQPEIRVLDDSDDKSTRWVQLRIPIDEGSRYTVGTLKFDGNTRISSEAFKDLLKIHSGEPYSEKRIREGLDKARDVYGAAGHYEFTAYPDLQPRDAAAGAPPIVDVTIRVQEGAQYFVNRITFVGNTHTRDDVIRRELALLEAGVFNTEALKYSLRRLNQLGYFKALDPNAVSVDKTPGADNRVDVRLKLEEQNRNQISFGAGASQYEGLFGNASFTTSNFLGRGEALTLSAQKGSRSGLYQVAFTEPFLFGRPITAGVNVFSRKFDYQVYSTEVDYSEVRTGFGTTAGWSFRRFTRLLATYGYEVIDTAASDAVEASAGGGGTGTTIPLLDEGRHTQSSITPSLVYNTVDSPLQPRQGMRLTASYQYAGGVLGGTTDFVKPEVEGVFYLPLTKRTALGFRGEAGWLFNYGAEALPYYLRFFLGGDTQIRGTDIRSVGPVNADGVPAGGTKFVLFNTELYFDIAPQVRALLFHDAGQAFREDDPWDLRQLRTSSGAELRVTLPMIGVPLRLIYAWNVYRDVTQPARRFRFSVGTTF